MTDGRDALEEALRELAQPMPAAPPVDRGSPRRTHVFVLDEVVVKCDAVDRVGSGSMVREGSALSLLEGSGLPVPRLLGSGELPDGRRWVALTRLAGQPPPDAARPAHELSPSIAGQIGAIIARLHAAAAPPAFGTWDHRPRRSFVEEHRQRIGVLERMGRGAGIVPGAELDAVLDLLRRTDDALHEVETPVLAHRDVQPRNVLVDGDAVTALLDFESAAGGDAAEDFRVVGLDWTTPAFAAFARAYADGGGSLGPTGPDRVAHYVAEWAVAVFAYLGGIAPAYLPPARIALERIAAGERPRLTSSAPGAGSATR